MEKDRKSVLVLMGYWTLNYGTVLQSAATMEMLKKFNCNPVALNMDKLRQIVYKRKVKYYLLSGDLGFILKSKGRQISRFVDPMFVEKLKSREKKFKDFIDAKIERSKPVNDFEEAGQVSLQYDCVLLGSDQVWLPSSVMTDVYTLSFAKDNKKIAYAPSFGISNIPVKYWNKYREMFMNIDYISLREERGKQIVEEISGRQCKVAADPVLMLNRQEWEKIINPEKTDIGNKYIFCYLLGRNRWQREWIKNFSQYTGYMTVGLLHLDEKIKFDEKYYDKQVIDVSPAGFLNYIRGAEIVITDSFHGMCFSIIEHKEFWVFKRFKDGDSVSTNSRIDSILSKFKLENRIITREKDVKEMSAGPINYLEVDREMEKLRKESYGFLKKAIGQV